MRENRIPLLNTLIPCNCNVEFVMSTREWWWWYSIPCNCSPILVMLIFTQTFVTVKRCQPTRNKAQNCDMQRRWSRYDLQLGAQRVSTFGFIVPKIFFEQLMRIICMMTNLGSFFHVAGSFFPSFLVNLYFTPLIWNWAFLILFAYLPHVAPK